MADVWKSQGRKFCEICKVWFGDNRASIEFHERGKKHKEALAAKIRELSRASREKEKAQAQMSTALAAMEAAALRTMRENGEGVEHGPALPSTGLASKIFDPRQLKDIGSMAREMAKRKNEMQEAKSQKRVAPSVPYSTPKYFKRELPVPVEYLEANIAIPKQEVESLPSYCEETVWVEADAGDGRTYYYHMYTGVSQWEQPKSFYTAEEYKRHVLERELSSSVVKNETVKHEQPPTDTSSNNVGICSVSQEKEADEPKVKMEPHDEEIATSLVVGEIPLPEAGLSATDVAVREEPLESTSDSNVDPVSTHSVTCESQPAVEICHSYIDEREEDRPTPPSHGPFGSWQRVGKGDKQPMFSPLTAKYRAEEARDRKLLEEKEKLAAKGEPKLEFTEKTGAVLTKKVKGPIEFKKRSAVKSVRQRIQ